MLDIYILLFVLDFRCMAS